MIGNWILSSITKTNLILARIEEYALKQDFNILLFLLLPRLLIFWLSISFYAQEYNRQAKMLSKPNMFILLSLNTDRQPRTLWGFLRIVKQLFKITDISHLADNLNLLF